MQISLAVDATYSSVGREQEVFIAVECQRFWSGELRPSCGTTLAGIRDSGTTTCKRRTRTRNSLDNPSSGVDAADAVAGILGEVNVAEAVISVSL